MKTLSGFKENVLLSKYTTFKIGGPARYFFVAKNAKDLVRAVKTARDFKLPFFILGSGSNILASDKGYKGMIIKVQMPNIKYRNKTIYAEAGTTLAGVVKLALEKSLTGLEWAAGIPGTIGAAVYGNVGAFGSIMADNVKSVTALSIDNLKIKKFSQKQCGFGNKDSIFKKNKNLVILSAVLAVKPGDKKEIESEIKRFLNYRKENHPLVLPSAGCIFKNYDKKIKNKSLLKKYPELIEFNKGSRIPTSYLIDKCGLKGKTIGGAKISEKHANFIVNLGNARAADVLKLIKTIKEKIKERFGIKIEEEVQYLGF